MDLLTTYTHHWELQAITTISFFSTLRITKAPAKTFPACCVFTSRFLVTASNNGDSSASCAQVWKPLVQNWTLNWQLTTKYSTHKVFSSQPNFELSLSVNSKLTGSVRGLFYDWLFTAVSSSWRQPLEIQEQYFFFQPNTFIVLMYHPLCREDGSVVYSCCWPSPAQSFSGSSPAELTTTFNCLRFETPPARRARSSYLYPPGT
jgi:hypothetical protein